MSRSPLAIHRLGRVEYEDGLRLQALFGKARAEEKCPDVLLLLEHPPVLTLGRGAKRENVLASSEQLDAEGIELHETNRGGDVTYHGPGQLVGYPILKLPKERQDVRRYVRNLEEVLIRAVGRHGITSARMPKWPGVWVGEEGSPTLGKIAAIGVHLSRWQTSHGFALNINTDLSHFRHIVPCGIREAGVTSIQKELGRPVPFDEVATGVAQDFVEVFEAEPLVPAPPRAIVSVTVVRGEDEVLCLRRRAEDGGFWQILTGGVEPGETPAGAARRELEEETGLALDVTPLGYHHTFAFGETVPPALFEETAFVARAPADARIRLSDEHEAHAWLRSDEALSRLPFAGLRRAVRMALAPRGR